MPTLSRKLRTVVKIEKIKLNINKQNMTWHGHKILLSRTGLP